MDFNKDRFLNFGRYDLIINKSFYRTLALVTIFGAIGISALGFVLRYILYVSFGESGLGNKDLWSCHNILFTTLMILALTSIMHIIFAGCTFHNLRNKQGRISELTLPATNLEKYTWHVALVFIGGFAIIIASIACADIVNALLNLAFRPWSDQNSIALTIGQLSTGRYPFDGSRSMDDLEDGSNFVKAIAFMGTAISLSGYAFFILGNAIKYKYNIIITYIIYEFSAFALVFSTGYIITHTTVGMPYRFITGEEAVAFVKLGCNIVAIFNLLLTLFYFWLSYKLYKKAQITSGWNK